MSSQSSLYGLGSSSTMPYANMAMGMGASSNPYSNNRKVFIGGLDPSFPDSQLREYFSKFGKIDGKKFLLNKKCNHLFLSISIRNRFTV
jgi:RNA recognition motif-containing protein